MTTNRRWIRVFSALLILGFATGFVARAQDNLRGAPYNGYTGVVFDTTHEPFEYLVDGSLAADDPAHKRFKTVQAAYAAAPEGTEAHRTVIGIKPDVYLLHGTLTMPGLEITKNYITLLGLTDDRRKVVIADNRGNQQGAANNGFSMTVAADGFSAINLTIANYCNFDYEYPGDASKNLKRRSDTITQAVAIQADGDKHVYSHVAFLSRLDTTFIRTKRSYFTHVFFEGTDDFIGGGQVGVMVDSEIYFTAGSGVSFSEGLTYIRTVFKATKGLEFYKIYRNPVALIECTLPANTPATPVAWMIWKRPERPYLYSLLYHTKDTTGKPAVLADSVVGPPVYTMSRELSDREVKAFNPWNLLRARIDGPVDDWDPAGVRAKYESAGSEVFRMALTNPAPNIRTGDKGAVIAAAVQPVRLKESPITWSTDSKLITLSNTTGESVTVTGRNTTDHAAVVAVNATAANGFFVTAHVYVEPAYIAPPAFTKQPQIGKPGGAKLTVDYALELGHRDDESLITWYQCADAACAQARAVAVSRGKEPLRSYTLTAGDVGHVMKVGIQPKHNISEPGAEVFAMSNGPVTAAELASTTVDPNFRNFVEATNETYTNGMWTVLGQWSVTADDTYRNGYGIHSISSGGRLLYQQDAPTRDMQVTVLMSPDKNQGQGFAIPGSPADSGVRVLHSDIYIKYDPRTQTGYSLRFWRTTLSSEKCMFQFFKIVNGVGTPLSEKKQLTGAFKPNMTLTVTAKGTTLTATGRNTMDGEILSLEDTIVPNSFGGAGVFWPGSITPGNSNVYSEIAITYPK